MTDTINKQALQAVQATPLEQARVYLYQNLRLVEKNAKPKGVAVQVRIAVDDYMRKSEQVRRNLEEELAASRHHAKGLKSYTDELLSNLEVHRDAYDNQKTLTRNALIESRNMADARYELEGQVRELKQLAGDAPAAQDIIDRLRERIDVLEGQLQAREHRLTEAYGDVRSAENYSDKLTEEVERQKEAVQRLLDLNGQLREAAGIAGDHVRGYNDDVGVLYQTLRDAQSQLTEYLTGKVGERKTLGRLLGILDNGIIYDAMHGELRHYAQTEASDA